ncbi:MAG: class I SAM-dependent methyltransferase [Thermoanaerobaculia bacterium]
MADHTGEIPDAVIEALRTGDSRSLGEWRALWESDREFPLEAHPGLVGRVKLWLKRVARRLVKGPQIDLWERQRAYNLTVQDGLEAVRPLQDEARALREMIAAVRADLAADLATLGRDLQTVQSELVRDLRETRDKQMKELLAVQEESALAEDVKNLQDQHLDYLGSHAKRLDNLEGFHNRGYDEVMDHTAALFSQLDNKMDRYRELSRERWGRLGGLLAVAEGEGPSARSDLAQAVADEKYLEFEAQFRGSEQDIAGRLEPYLETLRGRGEVLDLGCGRGEALEVLTASGIQCSGVDSNVEMVSRCREKGFEAEVGDLFSALESREEGSLGAIVSFHVIEHLPARELERLTRLAWRALAPGGVLVLETPNPVSVVVGASRFWIDPTHERPVHPESLKTLLELNGFEPVERFDLQPFDEEDRLPEIGTEGLPEEISLLVERINRLRDRIDELLFGFQDFGLIAHKPA